MINFKDARGHINYLSDSLRILRDDLTHPIVSGNKFRKLEYNIQGITERKFKNILSFGGAFSNHLHALAFALKDEPVTLQAYVRGNASYADNPTMKDILSWGAKVHFLNATAYKKRNEVSFVNDLMKKYDSCFYIPEGGSNDYALSGLKHLADQIKNINPRIEHVVLPIGTGGTAAGLHLHLQKSIKIHCISVGKERYLEANLAQLLGISPKDLPDRIQIHRDYHFGGYGRCPKRVRQFAKETYNRFNIILDPMYNAKALYACWDLINRNYFKPAEKILYIHTGGLQGIRGYKYLYPKTFTWLPNSFFDH